MTGSPRRAVLGISADYHDAAAAVIVDGEPVAAAAEERFSRIKHDPSLPVHAIEWCLTDAGVEPDGLAAVAFYSKPWTTYERIISTHARVGPRGVAALTSAVSEWSRSKAWVGDRIRRTLRRLGYDVPRVLFAEHHQSHAAAAFFPSPFDRAAILTFDGLGEWATSTIGSGRGNRIDLHQELTFPDSLGLLYSAMTAYCGFDVNDGEYKLMGLAPYGSPRYLDALLDRVVHLGDDGSVRLDQKYFAYRAGRSMTSPRMADVLGGPPRPADEPIGERHADIARSVQELVERSVLAIARRAHELTGESVACLAGGVALNCVANARLLRDGPFDDLWIQPAAGDDGSSLGAALWAWHQIDDQERPTPTGDAMRGAFLGPAYPADEVAAWLVDADVAHERVPDRSALDRLVAAELAAGSVVGWFRGRMEFGPRALGNRSILADPRSASMVQRINVAVKGREGFRPFAPAVLAERASEWFDLDHPSPYMLLVAPVRDARPEPDASGVPGDLAARLGSTRSGIAACTHVDGTARVQTVAADTAPEFHSLISAFDELTGCPVLLNTSFNRRDEPVVRTPADALRCFESIDLDLLVLEDCVVRRGATVAQHGPEGARA